MIIAAERLSQDPALAADPDYGFLLSGAFLKMGRSTKQGVTSMAMSASVWLQKGFGAKTFLGVGGPMFGRTMAQIQKFSESERKLTLKNLAEKMEAYKEIRDYLTELKVTVNRARSRTIRGVNVPDLITRLETLATMIRVSVTYSHSVGTIPLSLVARVAKLSVPVMP